VASAVGPDYGPARRRLVEALRVGGITDPAVLAAIEDAPRHLFVPTGVRHRAYEDSPQLIANKQTISQPSVHARYLQLLQLRGTERVLEIGTGSGYQTLLLSKLTEQVFSIERHRELLEGARDLLRTIGVRNASFLHGDGTIGWREFSPYDAILVSAASPGIPQPLVEQLAEGGRLLVPIGERDEQMLTMVTRVAGRLERRDITPVRFVPLVGTHGWTSP